MADPASRHRPRRGAVGGAPGLPGLSLVSPRCLDEGDELARPRGRTSTPPPELRRRLQRRQTLRRLIFRCGTYDLAGDQRIATALNLWVFGTARREKQMHSNLRGRDVREHPRTPNMTLGVKWSQVQIPSARPL